MLKHTCLSDPRDRLPFIDLGCGRDNVHDGSAVAHCFRCAYAEAWRARGSHHCHYRPGKAAFRPHAVFKARALGSERA